jgi:hypothetical protein
MFTRITTVAVLVCLTTGCAKKSAKFTGKADDSAAATPQLASKEKPADGADKKKSDDRPNWLTDPRAETEKDQLPVENQPEKPGLGVKLPVPELGAPPRIEPGPQPGKPMGVLQPQPAAPPATTTTPKLGGKPVSEADMKEVWIFIENASGASGRMPQPALVYSALVKAEAKAADLVKDGSIFLTGSTARESVWAFEWKALKQGGWVASQNGVENLSAAELKRRLGR